MENRDRFDVLDGLRGVAAGMVLLGHVTTVIAGGEAVTVPRKELAVVFFFMLSGFVITAAYQERIRAGLPMRSFMLKRLIRLYPLVFLGTVMGALWFATHAHNFSASPWWPLPIVTSMLVLPSQHVPYNFGRFPLNPPEWSLFMEMVAYILFALTLAKLTTKSLSLLTGIAFIAYAIVDFKYFGRNTPFPLPIFQALAAFSGGILLWRLRETGRFPRLGMPSWMLAAGIVAICVVPDRFGSLFDLAACLLAFPLIILLGAGYTSRSASFGERWLGHLSYPLYMLHWTIILMAQHYILPIYGAYVAEAVAILCAVIFAWGAFVLFDRPVRRWLTHRLIGKPEPISTEISQHAFMAKDDAYAGD